MCTSEASIGSFACGCLKENKYARKSLRTRSESTAVERGKAAYLEIYGNLQQGKSYFSITTKEGVEKYLSLRKSDVELGHIVSGRLATIATHLQHFLSFIGKDTKLKELERTNCENYFYHRHKATNTKVKQVTVQNEQSTINALMKWLNKNGETHALQKVKRLCKEFGFTSGMHKGALAEGRIKNKTVGNDD
ncbi:hypothetical protein OAB91_00485 [Alphaproteobacteria bacterium]|nr:hypothetical protein [Alphaproteobacteria bacterium]